MKTNKNNWAKTPPMGWNSWDCFGASVTEEELMANAEYMRDNLKEFGWEYVVCDIQWYEPDANSTEYRNFVPLDMDEYSRLIPAVKRFPSAADGKGFSVIAEKMHDMGLKFGIHMMRGIPRQAVHSNTPIFGTDATAREIAQRFSVCSWNTDMYGVDPNAYGAQAYYDSVFQLYASWGVDFVKVDDICNTYYKPHDLYSAKGEIELIRRAIDHCGRDIVLSLSPGPADLERIDHLQATANMWRMTADYWDDWKDLVSMFQKCASWAPYVEEGMWPDCDMLPMGHIGIRGNEHGLSGRYTRFSKAEQYTMMTLWCMFRSPLMFGGHLPDNDAFTLSLLTNKEVLRMLNHASGAYEVTRSGNAAENIVWKSYDEDGRIYVAIFNTHTIGKKIEVLLEQLELEGTYEIRDVWQQKDRGTVETAICTEVESHGVKLFVLSK
ncbi:MAG: glycoside hydrolase family 27 protein [Eubacteriales bacterium]